MPGQLTFLFLVGKHDVDAHSLVTGLKSSTCISWDFLKIGSLQCKACAAGTAYLPYWCWRGTILKYSLEHFVIGGVFPWECISPSSPQQSLLRELIQISPSSAVADPDPWTSSLVHAAHLAQYAGLTKTDSRDCSVPAGMFCAWWLSPGYPCPCHTAIILLFALTANSLVSCNAGRLWKMGVGVSPSKTTLKNVWTDC